MADALRRARRNLVLPGSEPESPGPGPGGAGGAAERPMLALVAQTGPVRRRQQLPDAPAHALDAGVEPAERSARPPPPPPAGIGHSARQQDTREPARVAAASGASRPARANGSAWSTRSELESGATPFHAGPESALGSSARSRSSSPSGDDELRQLSATLRANPKDSAKPPLQGDSLRHYTPRESPRQEPQTPSSAAGPGRSSPLPRRRRPPPGTGLG